MAEFQKAQWFTARWEGGISDHPADRGGYTAFGVCTEFMKDFAAKAKNRKLLESLGLTGTVNRALMKKIDARRAAAILRAAFWDIHNLDEFPQIPATVIYDACVNCGERTGLRLMQQAIRNIAGLPLAIDGIMGPQTGKALIAHGTDAVDEALKLREMRYHNIIAKNPSQKAFIKGWVNRINDLRKYVERLARQE